MDFTGLGRFTAYKINRSLTPEERTRAFNRKHATDTKPMDQLSVIRLNSTYLELVDRWYPGKGFAVWFGLMFAVPFASAAFAFIWMTFQKDELVAWIVGVAVALIFLLMAWLSVWILRHEAFRKTHYPIRLNRKTRQVYAFRPDGTILTAPWDKLFFCEGESVVPLYGKTHDIRAHVLADDGKTVKDTFTLGYVYLGKPEDVPTLWEYIRRYMEAPDGVEQSYRHTGICMPVDGRREGFLFGVFRTFAPGHAWPSLQLLLSPAWALNAWGRWIAMITSKIPRWPAEVEAACQIDPDDPCRKDWRNNGKYSFGELWWPLICFAIGTGAIVWGIVELGQALQAR